VANRAYKGRRFEIELAGRLSLWWTSGERDDVFWHTHDSGGRATKRTAKGKRTTGLYGDICAVDPVGKPLLDLICFEAKKGYNRATLHDLLDRGKKAKKQTWQEWIDKAERCREAAGARFWAIIHKRDQREAVIAFPWDMREAIATVCGYPDASDCEVRFEVIQSGRHVRHVVAMQLTDFLEWVEPATLVRILKRGKA